VFGWNTIPAVIIPNIVSKNSEVIAQPIYASLYTAMDGTTEITAVANVGISRCRTFAHAGRGWGELCGRSKVLMLFERLHRMRDFQSCRSATGHIQVN
jgi:hypothetical protein